MKKAVTLLLSLCLCLGLTVPAFAASDVISGECGEYTIWSFDKGTGTLTISGEGEIPAYWNQDDYLAEGIGPLVRTLVIEEGVTSIGESTFRSDATPNLTKVIIPKSVTSIGDQAFDGTLWLKSKGEFAVVNGILLRYQGSAKNVTIPGGVTAIASGAFRNNKSVTSVTIPEGVVALGTRGGDEFGNVFHGCRNLAEINFPSTLRYVGRYSFWETSWLEKQKGDFVMAGGVLVKYQGAQDADVVIPDGVTAVAPDAFETSHRVRTLTVPVSVDDLTGMSYYAVVAGHLPREIVYQGTREQWNKIKGADWLSEVEPWSGGGKIPIHCTGPVDPARVFTDMEPGAFYLKGVAWAVQHEVTTGTTRTTFSPKRNCTHAQILMFLWRAEGSPESSIVTPFSMTGTEDYYGAAKWAFEKGMINAGFQPAAPCSRADAVNYIWQARNKPYAVYDGRFADVAANSPYARAVAWAVSTGVTTGTSATAFNPSGTCTRGHIVTFLERAYNK